MAVTVGELIAKLKLDTSGFSAGVKEAEGQTKGLGSSFASVGSVISKLTIPLAAVGAAAVKSALDLDDAYDSIRIKTGATGAALDSLGKSFENVFANVPTSAANASEAISTLSIRTGLTGKALEDLSAQVLELSRLTGSDLNSTLETTTRLFGDWGAQIQSPTVALDELFRASQATGVSVDSLAATMVQFGSPLRQLGFDFETAAALAGKFQKEGVNTELVLGSMRIALNNMSKHGIKDAGEALQALIQQIKDAGSVGEATDLARKVFGGKAAADMTAAIREGKFEIADLVDKIKNGGDTIQKASKDTYGFSEAMTILKNQTMLALQPLGVTLVDAFTKLRPAIETIVGLLAKVIEWFSKLPEPIQTVIFALAAAQLAAKTFGTVGLGTVISTIPTVIRSLGMLGSALAASGLAWGGVAAAAVASIALIKWSLDEIAAERARVWDASGLAGGISIAGSLGLGGKTILAGSRPAASEGRRGGVPAELQGLIDGSGKAGKAAGKALKDEFMEQVNQWLTDSGKAIQISRKQWDELPVIIRNALSKNRDTFLDFKTNIDRLVIWMESGTEAGRRAFEHFRDSLWASSKDASKAVLDAAPLITGSHAKITTTVVTGNDIISKSIIALTGVMLKGSAEQIAAQQRTAAEVKQAHDTQISAYEDASRRIPQFMNSIAEGIANATNKTGDELLKFATHIKGVFGSVANVLGTLPGAAGEAARGVLHTVDTWFAFGDSILEMLNRLGLEVPQTMGDLIQVIVKKFQDGFSSVLGSVKDFGGKLLGGLKSVLGQMGNLLGNVGMIGGGAAAVIGSQFVGGTAGRLLGAGGGALLGAKLGSIIAPGIGTAIGAIGGAIIGGIFGGGGKSQAQKDAEKQAMENAKNQAKILEQQVLQAVEVTKQSLLTTVEKARDILESIRFYDSIGKDAIHAFFKDLRKFMNALADEAKSWASWATTEVKAAAENLRPAVELVSLLPATLAQISAHLKVPDIQFTTFFADADKLIEKLFEFADGLTRKVKRKIRQLGESGIGSGFELLSPIAAITQSLFDIKDVPDEQYDILDRTLDKLTQRIGVIAEKFSRGFVKAIGFFSTNVQPGVALWKETVDLIRSMVDLPMPSEQDFNNLFLSLETGLNRAIESAAKITSESLIYATAIWEKASSIFAAIKSGVEVATSIATAKWPDTAAWDSFAAAFTMMKDSLLLAAEQLLIGLDASILVKDRAAMIETNIAAAAASMARTAAAMGTGSAGTGMGTTAMPSRVGATASTTSVNNTTIINGLNLGDDPESAAVREAIERLLDRRLGRTSFGMQVAMD